MRARGAMPLIVPNTDAAPGRRHAVVAAGGRRRVGAVAVVVARRDELPRTLRLEARVAAPRGVEVLRADELLLQSRRRTALPSGRHLLKPGTCAGRGSRSSRRPCDRRRQGCPARCPESMSPMMMPSPAPLLARLWKRRRADPRGRPCPSARGTSGSTTCRPSAARRASP